MIMRCIFAVSCKKSVMKSKTRRINKSVQILEELSIHQAEKIGIKEEVLENKEAHYEEAKCPDISCLKHNCEGLCVSLSSLNKVNEMVQNNEPLQLAVKAVEPSNYKLVAPNDQITSTKWSEVVKRNVKYKHHLSHSSNSNYFQVS